MKTESKKTTTRIRAKQSMGGPQYFRDTDIHSQMSALPGREGGVGGGRRGREGKMRGGMGRGGFWRSHEYTSGSPPPLPSPPHCPSHTPNLSLSSLFFWTPSKRVDGSLPWALLLLVLCVSFSLSFPLVF